MIGLSTINCLNGGRGRLAPTVTALGVMLCTMVLYPLLNFIPISALAGVMIVVVLHTFKWAKVPMILSAFLPRDCREPFNKTICCCLPKSLQWMKLPLEVDRWEALIIIVVSVLTIMLNLVYGVGAGIVMAAVRFAFFTSLEADIKVARPIAGEPKRYILQGKLFFANALRFHNNFDVDNDPKEVVLQLAEQPYEYSAIDALARVTKLYAEQEKSFTWEVVPLKVTEMQPLRASDEPSSTQAVDEPAFSPKMTEMERPSADAGGTPDAAGSAL